MWLYICLCTCRLGSGGKKDKNAALTILQYGLSCHIAQMNSKIPYECMYYERKIQGAVETIILGGPGGTPGLDPLLQPASETKQDDSLASITEQVKDLSLDKKSQQKKTGEEVSAKDRELINRIFPQLNGTIFIYTNLAELHASGPIANTPIVDDIKAQEELLEKARGYQSDVCTVGGFGEDRDDLWRGKGVPHIHLGIDINNLPKGINVHSAIDGTVYHIMKDTDKVDGWGGRIIIKNKNEDNYVLYGHLDPESMPEVGIEVKTGDKIGIIGEPGQNGGYFRHGHVQVMDSDFIEYWSKDGWLNKLDGYADRELPLGVQDPFAVL